MIGIIIVICLFIGGVAKALRDTCTDHFDISIFSLIKDEFWYKWFKSHWKDKPGKDNWRYYFPFLWDGRHFGDALSYFPWAFLAVYSMLTQLRFLGLITYLVIFFVSFTLFYHRIFLIESHD